MFANKTSVLLTLPQDGLDRARVLAGRATTALKLPVSLQIVLRALIEEGLKWQTDPDLLANVERQARAVREIRSRKGRAGPGEEHHDNRPADRQRPGRQQRSAPRK
jgi:hypothetical protein